MGKLISACRARAEMSLKNNNSLTVQADNNSLSYQDNNSNNCTNSDTNNSNKFSFVCSTKDSSQYQEENYQKVDGE